MRFVNLTPHDIKVNGTVIPVSGVVARCSESSCPISVIDGIQIIKKEYGPVVDLPLPQSGVGFIVSTMVRAAVPKRKDVYSPGDAIRNGDGQIIGCQNLVSN